MARTRRQQDARAHRSEVRLTWPERTWNVGQFGVPPAPSEVDEWVGDAQHRLIAGDALDVARSLASDWTGKVDLIYLDPPFASQADYILETRLDGPADGRVKRSLAYVDHWQDGVGAYLDMLAPRLEAMANLLAPTGTFWIHLDWRAAYLVRVLMDEILGRDAFLNEIVWRRAPNLGRQAKSQQFGRTLDTIMVYGGPQAKLSPPTRLEPIDEAAIRWDEQGRPFTAAPRGDYTDASIAKLDAEGRVHRTASGKVYIKYFLTQNRLGQWCRERRVDTLWTDVAPLRHVAVSERTGYPTQKPRALLERIIACATPPGGTVVDLFCGSGTTGEAAHVLGRRAILGDAGCAALATTRARLLRAGAGLSVESLAKAPTSPAQAKLERINLAEWSVTLLTPDEPLAWSVLSHGPRRALWHSERVPGVKPVPATREARIDVPPPYLVRAFDHDGALLVSDVTS